MKKTVLALSLILFMLFVFINDVKADKPESCLYKFKVGNTGAECSFNFYNNSDLDLDFTCTGENVSKFEINDYKVNYKEKNYYIQPDHNLITLMNNYKFGDFSVLNGEQCKQLYWDAYIGGTANNSLYISLSATATNNQFLYDSSQKTLKKAEIPDTLFAEDKDLNITCDYKYKYDIENLKNLNGNVKAKIDYETGYLTFDDGEQIELENRNCPNYIVQNCTSQICYYSAYDVLPENPNFTYIFSQKKMSTLKKSCGQYEMYEYTYTSDNCKREKSKTTKKFSFY